MRHVIAAVALVAVLGTVVPLAGGGELKPVAKGLEDQLGGVSGTAPCGSARGASGLTSRKAVVASFPVGPGQTVKVAVDYSNDSLTQPDLVRFDFAGTGAFNDTQVAKVRWTGGNVGRFGPTTMTVQHSGRTLPVAVQGYCLNRGQEGGQGYTVGAGFVTAAEGPCQFGQKSYTVRVVDGSGNLSLRDGLKLPVVGGDPGQAVMSQNADKVAVLSGDGKELSWGYYGQPLCVDGAWYTFTISDDQTSISAAKLEVPMAELRAAAAEWRAMLVGRTYVLELSGGKEPMSIPADSYALGVCAEVALRDGRRAGEVTCTGDAKPLVKAEAGKAVELPALTPLRGKVKAEQRGDTVVFSFESKAASGLAVSTLFVADEQGRMSQPQPPRVKVFDARGKLIYQADLQYG
ncbi:MAG: hypothetical protein MUP47_02140 [Phycisphaerae bacterium]|nr:hypothetical protein [Phycisphaerae bacterium]